MNVRTVSYQLIIVLFLLFLIEAGAYVFLKQQGQSFGFFLNVHFSEEMNSATEIGFDEIHPLWGWNMSSKVLRQKGYEVQNGMPLLRGSAKGLPLRIFVTGGSTSDVALNPENWPVALHHLLNDSGVPHIIYVAAVGGFNSAQEYLRLIEKGVDLRPDIHISYSGANETGDYGFVTEYEKDFYIRMVSQNSTTFFLPNTVFAIKQALGITRGVTVAKLTQNSTAARFKKNLKLMKASAACFGYRYIGVLQPLNGIGSYTQKNTHKNVSYLNDYKKYYSDMMKFVHTDTALHDFTAIFDTATSPVYVDDCHLHSPYQKVVAKEIFKIMQP